MAQKKSSLDPIISNPEDQKILLDAMAQTWSVICYDMPEDTTNAIAVEVVLDADYVSNYGGNNKARAIELLAEAYKVHGYSKVQKALRKAINLV